MMPMVDLHCHLLAGMDDGPRDDGDALAMCRLAYAEGIRMAAATAHQNESWPLVTPDRIRQATDRLSDMLREADIPLTVHPSAEVMLHPEIEASWAEGALLSVADRKQFLLLEMPHGLFIDPTPFVQALAEQGIRPLLAHPERHPEFLHDPGRIEALIAAGCLVQVSSGSLTRPASKEDLTALKDWLRRGVVHVLGSDGHSPRSRQPRMQEAYRLIRDLIGEQGADRVCSINGMSVLRGLPIRVQPPRPRPVRRFWCLW